MEDLIGKVLQRWKPTQGCNYDVTILRTAQGRFVCKTGDSPAKVQSLEREADVVSALSAFQPAVARFVVRKGNSFYFTFLAGTDLADVFALHQDKTTRLQLSGEMGRFLHLIHAWKPILPRPGNWLGEAVIRCLQYAAQFPNQAVDEFNTHCGKTFSELIPVLDSNAMKYRTELVFAHGDWCLPNILMQGTGVNSHVIGAVDWGDGGYADYRYDLATGLWSLRRNSGNDPHLPLYEAAFLANYGDAADSETLGFFEAIYALL